ncbi:MAG: 4-hydroxy-3-methylbut-2-enyl diphosphate reductase [Verrucomicrobiota bacterium]
MSQPPESSIIPAKKRLKKRVNVRRPDVMALVEDEVRDHYRSSIVERIRAHGGVLAIGNTTVRLAKQFGFCYGVERAIDLSYAARRVFPTNRIFLIGEIIHNPEVNRQLVEMGITSLDWENLTQEYEDLGEEDVVIVPAFGTSMPFMNKLQERGVYVIDTTCGDVMSVWKRVKNNAKGGYTSIIHGKKGHEETLATASRALGTDGTGHYLVLLTLAECDLVCDYIRNGGDKQAFLTRFAEAYSPGFDPDVHLVKVGLANQTTMLESETEEIQRRVKNAIVARYGQEEIADHYQSFDTICGATQERQDALYEMLREKMDLLLVVGGYNSSNTTHLVEIGEKELPSFFIRSASCLQSFERIVHYDLEQQTEVEAYSQKFNQLDRAMVVGITAGASCPNNLIEATVLRIFELRGIDREGVVAALPPVTS